MLMEFGRRIDWHSENFNKERKYKCQTEVTKLKNVLTELQNILEGFSSRPDEAELISDLEDRAMQFTQTEQEKEKEKKKTLKK